MRLGATGSGASQAARPPAPAAPPDPPEGAPPLPAAPPPLPATPPGGGFLPRETARPHPIGALSTPTTAAKAAAPTAPFDSFMFLKPHRRSRMAQKSSAG